MVKEDGTFTVTHSGFLSGDYLFALRVYDKDGRDSGILAFTLAVYGDLAEAKDILVPPTIALSASHATKNDTLSVEGYAVPSHTIELEIDRSIFQSTQADQSGFWSFPMDTRYLSFGTHTVRVRQSSPATNAYNFSRTRVFKVSRLVAPQADFTRDGVVDIADWSIFLFRWENKDDEKIHMQNDLNGDGKVDVFDFSIFLKAFNL